MDDCIFCKIVAGEIPAKKVGENEGALAFPDINPCAPVHILVIPKKHVPSLNDVGDGSVLAPVFALAAQMAREKGIDKTGWRSVFNTGPDAHQLVFHVHMHLLGGRKFTWPPG